MQQRRSISHHQLFIPVRARARHTAWEQLGRGPTATPPPVLMAASRLSHWGPMDSHLCRVTQYPDGCHPAEQMASKALAMLRPALGSLLTRISKNREAHRPALYQGQQACLVADVSGQKVPSSMSPERCHCQCSPSLFLKVPSPRRGHRTPDSCRQKGRALRTGPLADKKEPARHQGPSNSTQLSARRQGP